MPGDVEHIHGDPHFRETIGDTIGASTFDPVVATYGRIRHTANSPSPRSSR